MTSKYKKPGILRAGFAYQDLCAVRILIDFYRQPDVYDWLELESEDSTFASIDDIVACRTDGRFEVTQVKFTVDPSNPANCLDWNWLLKRSARGRSLLQKWSATTARCAAAGKLASAELVTDRRPSSSFADSLDGQAIDLAKVEPEILDAIVKQLGSRAAATDFFSRFRFLHSQPFLDDLGFELRSRLVPADTDEDGWANLLHAVKEWATLKKRPSPDGRVRHSHIRAVLSRERPRPLDQDFDVPSAYQPPDPAFDDALRDRIEENDGVTVVWGTPGRGKSTYLSYCFARLQAGNQICIRHHYFLRLSDHNSARFFYHDIETSLIRQLERQLPDLDLARSPLAEWLDAAAQRAGELGRRLVIFIDGLDHVWREDQSLDHMQQLFQVLLPARPNTHVVVGTQKIAPKHLPRRLLQYCPQEQWRELPPMSRAGIARWLAGQQKVGRLQLEGSAKPAAEIHALADAFESVTVGVPLHLIYAFEMLTRPGGVLSKDAVLRLPPNPTGDIRDYYRALWTRISATAREILHGLASIDFPMPPGGLHRCFAAKPGAAEAIEEIDHLLDHKETGAFPFHGSVFVFVRDQVDHDVVAGALQPTLLAWLDDAAPPYWKWAWTWITKASFGDPQPLLSGPNRAWTLEALATGHPPEQIERILHDAETLAFETLDFARANELRALRIRVSNAPEFQTTRFGEFVEATVRLGASDYRIVGLRAGMRNEDPDILIALLRALEPKAAEVTAEAVLNELNRRAVASHLEDERQVDLPAAIVRVLPYLSNFDPARLKRYAHAHARSDGLISIAIDEALAADRYGTALTFAGLHRGPLCDRGLFAALCLDGADPRGRPGFKGLASRPQFHALYAIRGWTLPRRTLGIKVGEFVRSAREIEDRAAVTPKAYQFFFRVVSAALGGRGERVRLEGLDAIPDPWSRDAYAAIAEAALALAECLDAGSPLPTLAEFYSGLALPRQRNSSYDAQSLYIGLRLAVRDVAHDIQLLRRAADPTALVQAGDIPDPENPLWLDELWLDLAAERRLPIHEPDGADILLQRVDAQLDIEVTEFNERSDLCIHASLFALDNGLKERGRHFLLRASRCFLGYGWRKDPAGFEVLEALAAMASEDPTWAAGQCLRLAPAFTAITNYTDGDETNHARSSYYDAVADLLPERAGELYGELIQSDAWFYAENLLSHITPKLAPSDPHDRALLATMIQPAELDDVRAHIAKRGVAGEAVIADLSRKIGYSRPRAPQDRGSSTSRSTKPPRSAPRPTAYPPDQIDAYRAAVASAKGYGWKDRALTRWFLHWRREGQGLAALAALRKIASGEHSSYELDKTYDLAFETSLELEGKQAAFFWLVAGQRHRHGWNRWYTSRKEAEARLALAAKHYPDRWAEFVRESSAPVFERPTERSSLVMGQSRLVKFLLQVGEHERARALAAMIVDVMIAEVEEQPLLIPAWAR